MPDPLCKLYSPNMPPTVIVLHTKEADLIVAFCSCILQVRGWNYDQADLIFTVFCSLSNSMSVQAIPILNNLTGPWRAIVNWAIVSATHISHKCSIMNCSSAARNPIKIQTLLKLTNKMEET
jgi:hypothetical protein